MSYAPHVRYCPTSDGVTIAYAVEEGGPGTPLIWCQGVPFSDLRHERWGREQLFPLELFSRSRPVATFDFRGCGLSDRDVADVSMDALARDLEAVVDRLGWERFALFGRFTTGPMTMRYAAEHPERVSSLVLLETYARAAEANTVPSWRALRGVLEADWESYVSLLAVTVAGWDGAQGLAEWMGRTSTPDLARAFWAAADAYDATAYVSKIAARTLVIGRHDRPVPTPEMLRQLGARIRDARVVILGEGVHGWDESLGVVEEFLEEGDAQSSAPPGSVAPKDEGAAVILFTDIVSSTELTERMGDARFRDASRTLDAGLRGAIRDAGGVAIDGKLLGDGVLATFRSAAQAIEGARRCLALSAASELGLHIGVHAGDVIREERNVFGGAVNIAARICGLSVPGEILVSDVVRGMARSSAGVVFEDRGEQEMKGVGEPVRVYAVRVGGEG
jgi:pimeloyl-ACP methyl ester carboxylesterase